MTYRRAHSIESPEWMGLLRCGYCWSVAAEEDWDVIGLNEGFMQCLTCGEISMPYRVVAEEAIEPLPREQQLGLDFDGLEARE